MLEQNDDSQISLSFIESDDDDDETDLVEIKLSSASLKIKVVKFFEYSLLFRNKYMTKESRNNLSDDILQFQRKCNINESNMILFFELIQDKSVTITQNNYFDLRKISKYFQVKRLHKLLDNFSKSQFLGIEFLISQLIEQNQIENDFNGQYQYLIDNEAINMLSKEVNKCLQSELFEKLPIPTIYHIISKSDKNTLSSDLLYDFINKSIEERYILFHFISVGKLSDEKCNAIFESTNSHPKSFLITQNIPADLDCIIKQRNENKNLQVERSEFQRQASELNAQNSQLQSRISELDAQNNQLQSRISELDAQNNQLQSRISELDTQNNQLQSRISELDAQNGQLQSNILNLNTEKSQFRSQIIELKSQLQKLERILYNKHLSQFNKNNPFNGIISCLKDRWGENVFEHLEITSSSTFSYRVIPQNVINYDPDSKHFCSEDIENSWISFDFKEYRIVPSSYMLQVKKRKVYPINWSIEVSNDNENWESIDEQVNCQLLGDFQIHNFEVNNDSNNDKSFRYIRMKMNGKNSGGATSTLIIQVFEIYGDLISCSDI